MRSLRWHTLLFLHPILIVLLSWQLALGNLWPLAETAAELQKLCGIHNAIPTSYKLEGVVREGDRSQRMSQVIEIWKGRYKDEVVALKVYKVSRQDPHRLQFKSVSVPRGGDSFVVVLMGDIAVLQGNGVGKTAHAR